MGGDMVIPLVIPLSRVIKGQFKGLADLLNVGDLGIRNLSAVSFRVGNSLR